MMSWRVAVCHRWATVTLMATPSLNSPSQLRAETAEWTTARTVITWSRRPHHHHQHQHQQQQQQRLHRSPIRRPTSSHSLLHRHHASLRNSEWRPTEAHQVTGSRSRAVFSIRWRDKDERRAMNGLTVNSGSANRKHFALSSSRNSWHGQHLVGEKQITLCRLPGSGSTRVVAEKDSRLTLRAGSRRVKLSSKPVAREAATGFFGRQWVL